MVAVPSKWIENSKVLDKSLVTGSAFDRSQDKLVPHFMGLDIGLKNDGTAVTIGHWVTEFIKDNPVKKLEIDVSTVRYARNENRAFFEIEEIADWVCMWARRYNIQSGLTDQYYGLTAVPAMKKKGFKNISFKHFTQALNTEMFSVLDSYLSKGLLRMPVSDLTEELQNLVIDPAARYAVAPVGGHDDLTDSFARMVYTAHISR